MDKWIDDGYTNGQVIRWTHEGREKLKHSEK